MSGGARQRPDRRWDSSKEVAALPELRFTFKANAQWKQAGGNFG